MKSSRGMGTGGVSLLIIFVVLCAVIFGTLSLFLAEADLNMSVRAREAVQDYYAADAAAVRKLAEVAGVLAAGGDLYTVGGIAAEEGWDGELTIRFNVPIDAIRTLRVVLLAGEGIGGYRIQAWSVVTDTSEFFTGDDGFELWDGEISEDWTFDD
jgi:hypothetical protein